MPPRADTIVDPRFGTELRRLRQERGLSLRQLAVIVNHGKSLLHQLETGRTRPSNEIAVRLDSALAADGQLAALVEPAPDDGRLAYSTRHPHRVDAATATALSDLLASYRLLEDSIGAASVLPPVRIQLDTVVTLLRNSGYKVRPRIVDIAGQWAQFAGWLYLANGDDRGARTWLNRSLEWALEAGSRDLAATVLSFQGHHAEGRGELSAMICLSRAARRDHCVYPGLRAYCAGQEARALTMVCADTSDVLSCLAEAEDVAAQAGEQSNPPFGYWYSPAFFAIQRGIVYRYLGASDAHANDRAIELLTAGTAALAESAGGADWYGRHLVHLAVAHQQAGDRSTAGDVLAAADRIATATSSRQLAEQVIATVRYLDRP